MKIFNKEITEDKYIKRKDLINKYGEKVGLEIFNGNISEDEHNNRKLNFDFKDKSKAKEKIKGGKKRES